MERFASVLRMNRSALLLVAAIGGATLVAGCVAPPTNLVCRAASDGNHLAWDEAENATHYKVYRGDSDFLNATHIGTTDDTSFHDANVTAGETYRYWVTSVGPWPQEVIDEAEKQNETLPEENESLPSEVCEVTTVPEFPTLAVGALALAGAVGAYATMRRK